MVLPKQRVAGAALAARRTDAIVLVSSRFFLDRDKFAASFAADVPPGQAAFMADSQVPWGVAALQGAVTQPAWRDLPSWYLIATDDRMIPPAAHHVMYGRAGSTVTEVAASQSVYVSQPQAVVSLIKQAAAGRR